MHVHSGLRHQLSGGGGGSPQCDDNDAPPPPPPPPTAGNLEEEEEEEEERWRDYPEPLSLSPSHRLPSAAFAAYTQSPTPPTPQPSSRIISRVAHSVYCRDRYQTLPVCFGENDADSCPPPRIRYV